MGRRIDRWEGAIFVLYCIVYVGYLVLESTGHVAAAGYGRALLVVVVPLSVLTLGVIAYREREA
ncbi:MAG: hypothetical protein ABEN55_15735 [Bradymonadaceae bacterium]